MKKKHVFESNYTNYVESRRIKDIDKIFLDSFGNDYKRYRKQWEQATETKTAPVFPIHIDFEFIDACNLSCIMCPRNIKVNKTTNLILGSGKKLSKDLFSKIIDEGSQYRLASINLGAAAESLLLKDEICEYIAYARSKNVIDIRLVTNGLLLTPKLMRNLIDSGLTYLAISLDAFTAETYTTIRGADLEKAKNNILSALETRRKMKSNFPVIRVSFAIMNENKEEKESFFEYWKDHVDFVDFQGFIDYYNLQFNNNFTCLEPWRRVMVWADGQVAPCCSFFGKKLIIGNAVNQSIKEIWDGVSLKNLRDAHLRHKYSEYCLKCYGSRDSILGK